MTAISEDDPRLVFVPENEATQPIPGIIECIKDSWWVIHPTKGLLFYRSRGYGARNSPTPQHNRNKTLADSFAANLYPWAEVRQIPFVFRRIDISDYV